MSAEQFNELITLLTDYGSSISTCVILITIVILCFTVFRFFVWICNENKHIESKYKAIDNIKRNVDHVVHYRHTGQTDVYNYYVDCLIVDHDKLYNK